MDDQVNAALIDAAEDVAERARRMLDGSDGKTGQQVAAFVRALRLAADSIEEAAS